MLTTDSEQVVRQIMQLLSTKDRKTLRSMAMVMAALTGLVVMLTLAAGVLS